MLAIAESAPREDDAGLLWFLDTSVRVRVAAAEGVDGMSVVECDGPAGHSPPLHIHHDEDEVFHVIEGVLRLRLGDRELRLAAGDTMLAPMGRPHTFRVESKGGARWQAITCNGSFEAFVREMSRPELEQFYLKHYAPDASALIMVGDVSFEEAENLAERCLGSWTVENFGDVNVPRVAPPRRATYFIDRPGAAQSEIRVAMLAPPRSTPDRTRRRCRTPTGVFASRTSRCD